MTPRDLVRLRRARVLADRRACAFRDPAGNLLHVDGALARPVGAGR